MSMLPSLVHVLLALVVIIQVTHATIDHAAGFAQILQKRDAGELDQELSAATTTRLLSKRHATFFPMTQVELIYAERDNPKEELIAGVAVRCKSAVPVLLLEEFEHLTERIECTPGQLIITIPPSNEDVAAKNTIMQLVRGGLVITSHYGCNLHGERNLLRVGNVSIDETESVFVLDTVQVPWKESFTSINIKLYRTNQKHEIRPQFGLRQRQSDPTPTVENFASISTIIVPKPTETRVEDVYHLDLNKGVINERLLGNENSSFQLTCKNCSTFGTLDFSFNGFVWNPSNVSDGKFELGDYFEGGEMAVVANNMGARMELLTNITGSNAFGLPLFVVPLVYGVAVKGFAAIGLLYAPTIHVVYNLTGSISFTYGFEINVPDKSNLFIDLTQPRNSSISGFDETTITEIPFQSSIEVSEASVNISLRHEVQVGLWYDIGIGEVGLGVGAYLDLPKYVADFEKVQGVDESCKSLAASQSENKDLAQQVLTDVYNITPSVGWQFGLAGEYKIIITKDEFDWPLADGTFANLENSCMHYNATSRQYVNAKTAVLEAKKRSPGTSRASTMNSVLATFTAVILAFAV